MGVLRVGDPQQRFGLSDSCFEFLHSMAAASEELAREVHHDSAPDHPLRAAAFPSPPRQVRANYWHVRTRRWRPQRVGQPPGQTITFETAMKKRHQDKIQAGENAAWPGVNAGSFSLPTAALGELF